MYKNFVNTNNFNTITVLLKEFNEAGFVYRIRTEDKIDINKRVIKYKII